MSDHQTNMRPVVHRYNVQPDLNVVVEDSLNILLEVTQPNAGPVILRTSAVSNVDRLIEALRHTREWVAAEERGAGHEMVEAGVGRNLPAHDGWEAGKRAEYWRELAAASQDRSEQRKEARS